MRGNDSDIPGGDARTLASPNPSAATCARPPGEEKRVVTRPPVAVKASPATGPAPGSRQDEQCDKNRQKKRSGPWAHRPLAHRFLPKYEVRIQFLLFRVRMLRDRIDDQPIVCTLHDLVALLPSLPGPE